ncbi:nucleotidyltransferase family protein [Rhizobium tubonense]|uniref:nucleotidyltransferase family protein n=1 Tax=Rhizobium tubonense TaxID=484088 RepID=UPI003084099E
MGGRALGPDSRGILWATRFDRCQNQARVHSWYEARSGTRSIRTSTAEAITTFPTTAAAIVASSPRRVGAVRSIRTFGLA